MKLSELPAQGITFQDLALDKELAIEIQLRLQGFGILDPKADGQFGTQSKFALQVFAKQVGQEVGDTLTKALADALLQSSSPTLFPLEPGDDFAGRIVRYMQMKDYWVARAPGYLNIVYVEGVDEDGTPNADEPNKWNDRRIVIQVKNRKPVIVGNWDATTEPGFFFTFHPENPAGAARIAFGQYKSWIVGTHHAGKPGAHEALVQADVITVHRDFNKDMKRTDDKTDAGMGFGVNQHKGFNMPPGDIGRASAGCLVGRTNKGHEEFMALVKTDPRYAKASHAYKYMTAVIAGDDLKNTIG